MFQGENPTTYYYGTDYPNLGDQGYPPGGDGTEAASELSEAQVKYESPQAYHVSLNDVAPPSMMTTLLTDDPFMGESYCLTETAGFLYSMQYGKSRGDETLEALVLHNHWACHEDEAISNGTGMNMMECQQESEITPPNLQLHDLPFSLQASGNDSGSADVHSEFHKKTARSTSTTKPSRSLTGKARHRNKENANRKFIFDEQLRAVQELLPKTLKVNQDSVLSNQESVLDNAIRYIKYLELQLKDLTAAVLGGESESAPVFFLEPHGHGHPHDDDKELMFKEPLEDVFGRLFQENPAAAFALLESHGLHMLPIDLVQDIRKDIV